MDLEQVYSAIVELNRAWDGYIYVQYYVGRVNRLVLSVRYSTYRTWICETHDAAYQVVQVIDAILGIGDLDGS